MSQRRHIDSLTKLFLVALSLTLGFVILFISVTAIGIGWWVAHQLQTFTTAAQTSPAELLTLGTVGWHTNPAQTQGRKNFLVLGLDSLQTRGDAPPLTDTIMLVSLDLQTGGITTLSLPRDLYLEEYQSRINALYRFGLEQQPENPEHLPQTAISHLTGVPIHHTVVVSLEEVGQLIDLIGGVKLNVPTGFVDEQFPRTDVDVTVERDPAKLYERVEFQPGQQTMSGETALKYIRSRHAEGDEGNDHARSNRQQLVIQSLLTQLLQPQHFTNPAKLGQLYGFYKQHFADDFPTVEAIATAKVVLPHRHNLTFTGSSLSIYPVEPDGVLFHPPLSAYAGQWVYVIRDRATFQSEVQTKLSLPTESPTEASL